MDNRKEIKELKKAYKKARLFCLESEAELHRIRLKELLGEVRDRLSRKGWRIAFRVDGKGKMLDSFLGVARYASSA